MAQRRVKAPVTFERDTTTSYPADGVVFVHGARTLQVGLFEDGTGQVAGTLKFRIGEGVSIEVGLPANNLYELKVPGGCSKDCLPVIELDAKATAGTPKLIVLAV